MKFYSEQTNKMYNTPEELEKAEKEFLEKKDKKEIEVTKAKQSYEDAKKKLDDLLEAETKLKSFILEEKEKFDKEAREKLFSMQRKVSAAKEELNKADANLTELTKSKATAPGLADILFSMLDLF